MSAGICPEAARVKKDPECTVTDGASRMSGVASVGKRESRGEAVAAPRGPASAERARGRVPQRNSRTHTLQHPAEADLLARVQAQLKKNFNMLLKNSQLHVNDGHTSKKVYVCQICQKKYSLMGDLKNHTRSHTGERPYSCEICKKEFTQRKTLLEHERIHTGEKPYTCEVCKKKFIQRNHLKAHARVHTRNKHTPTN